MWSVPLLLWVLGSALLGAPAEGAVTVPPEDDVTTLGMEDGMVTLSVEGNTATPRASAEPAVSTGSTTLVPTNVKSTDIPIEDLPTSESTIQAHESQSTTASSVATSHSMGDTQTRGEKDGFTPGTLIGIIIGVLLAIGFIGGIIIVAVRKMSGRYTP